MKIVLIKDPALAPILQARLGTDYTVYVSNEIVAAIEEYDVGPDRMRTVDKMLTYLKSVQHTADCYEKKVPVVPMQIIEDWIERHA